MQYPLKIWPQFFELVILGLKDFEIRNNDRNFKVGDKIQATEFNPVTDKSTGRQIKGRISHVLKDCPGLLPGYVALSMRWELEDFHNSQPT